MKEIYKYSSSSGSVCDFVDYYSPLTLNAAWTVCSSGFSGRVSECAVQKYTVKFNFQNFKLMVLLLAGGMIFQFVCSVIVASNEDASFSR